MKYIFAAILAITLMFSTGYARDLPNIMPHLEVTGLIVSYNAKTKDACIINDRIAYQGDIFEVIDDYLGDKIVPGGRVKVGPVTLEIIGITKKGVLVGYTEKETGYTKVKLIPLKSRPKVY